MLLGSGTSLMPRPLEDAKGCIHKQDHCSAVHRAPKCDCQHSRTVGLCQVGWAAGSLDVKLNSISTSVMQRSLQQPV